MHSFLLHPWLRLLIAPLAGAVTTLALAPFDLWPLAILSHGLLFVLLHTANPRQGLLTGLLYGLGLFLSGASWVYVSIHDHGAASPVLAGFLTLLFATALALFHGLFGWLWVRFVSPQRGALLTAAAFAALWLAIDALRSWLLTGFPWLYSGYSQLDGPLAGFVPLGGVWLASFLLAFMAVLLAQLGLAPFCRKRTFKLVSLPVLILLSGLLLQKPHWTQPAGAPLSVSLIQGNVEQELKWEPDQLLNQLDLYRNLTLQAPATDLVVWPETAVPLFSDSADSYLEFMRRNMEMRDSALITGVPVRQQDVRGQRSFYNGILGLGHASGQYFKQKLVPFGEYVPMQDWLRGLIEFFDLPMSDFSQGPAGQSPLLLHDYRIAPYICYEVVYPDFARQLAKQSEILLTISNDTWFGRSIGPLQHMQMAQMRALEAGRWMIRSTNNGVSALIDPQGRVSQVLPQFEQAVLQGDIVPMRGLTPYLRFGSWPLIVLCSLILILALFQRLRA